MKSNIEFLYEELRKATDGGSESMTHDDALKQISYWRDKCSQTQQVAVPAGYVLVPLIPTPSMIVAGRNAPMCTTAASSVIEDYIELYKAMLAAAPQPPQGDKT